MTQGFLNFFLKTWLQNEPSLNHQLREAFKKTDYFMTMLQKGGGGRNYDIRGGGLIPKFKLSIANF